MTTPTPPESQDDVLAALVDVLTFVTEEGETAARFWAPDILRLMAERGYRITAAATDTPSDIRP